MDQRTESREPMRPRGRAWQTAMAVIIGWWIFVLARLAHAGAEPATPGSVTQLALYAAVRAVLVVAIIGFLLHAGGESLASLGLSGEALRAAMLRGLLLAVGLFVLINGGVNSLLAAVGIHGRSWDVAALFKDVREAPLWIFAAVIGGGFTEELERAFVLTRFEQGWGRPGLVTAVVLDSTFFGLGHLYQGLSGAIAAGVTGLAFALIYLHRRRVADAIVAHAGFDVIGVVAAYALYAGRS